MKKICIVSTAPTYPTNAGHRARIKGLVDEYCSLGLEVHFLFVKNYEEEILHKEEEYFSGRFHIIQRNSFIPWNAIWIKTFNRIISLLYKLMKKPENQLVDACYPFLYHKNLKKKLIEINPDYIQVEYIFLSYILKSFPLKTKIIDTHDVFHNRNTRIPKANWYSTFKSEERKALNRADFVLAITEEDCKTFLSYKVESEIKIVGHIIPLENYEIKSSHSINRNKIVIGFIGSINRVNINACNALITNLADLENIRIVIAGDICNSFQYINSRDSLELIGNVTLDDFYKRIDILYNPVEISTGLKIKNVEALIYNKILITTNDGAQGLTEGKDFAFVCCNQPEQFQDVLNQAISKKLFPQKFIFNKITQWRNNLRSIFL